MPPTFCSNVKSSLLKLLCNLARLKPPSTTYTLLISNQISLASLLTIAISNF